MLKPIIMMKLRIWLTSSRTLSGKKKANILRLQLNRHNLHAVILDLTAKKEWKLQCFNPVINNVLMKRKRLYFPHLKLSLHESLAVYPISTIRACNCSAQWFWPVKHCSLRVPWWTDEKRYKNNEPWSYVLRKHFSLL